MQIGKYEILERLGEGGMGTVYRAQDPLLDRTVAIKVISGEALDETAHMLFEREAKAIARLSHPNIVTIFEFDFWQGRPYIVMELLKGQDLHDYIESKDIALPEKLEIILQVCNGLSHAHSQNIIHRDIKPANIFILQDGSVKITDFGVARLTASTMTRDMILGTPEFIAPERWQGGGIDHRSDIFSVGVVLYWLLTGVNPFEGDEVPQVFNRIMNETPPPPDLGLPEAPANLLQSILDAALAKEAGHRYADAADMASDLRVMIGMLSTVEPGSPRATAAQEMRRTATPAVRTPQPPVTASGPTAPRHPSASQEAGEFPLSPAFRTRVLLFVALLLAGFSGAYFVWRNATSSPAPSQEGTGSSPAAASPSVQLGIACSSEKKAWLEKSVKGFAATAAGRSTRINLIPMGSLDAANALLSGDRRIQAWAPASQIYEGLFLQEWRKKYSQNPMVKEQTLALTPMVFVMWQSRYDEFIRKYGALSFATLIQAISRPDWQAIAGRPQWGAFRFGFPDPTASNCGLAALLTMAHEYFKSPLPLRAADLSDPGFQRWLQALRKHNPRPMKEAAQLSERMMLTGPPSYDVVFTYESLAIDLLQQAEGRWEPLRVVYPVYNVWSENPYYVLDVPWSSPQQRQAAGRFLDYLLGTEPQKDLISFGFRPGNTRVPVNLTSGPFQQFRSFGLQYAEGTAVDPPDASTVETLLKIWRQ